MLEVILIIASIIEVTITLGIASYIAVKSDTEKYENSNNFVLSVLGDFIKGLFVNKNWFGVALSAIAFTLSIPAIILILFVEVLLWLLYFLYVLWDFGNKKSS